MKHPVLDTLAVTAACGLNDRHNEQMLREGRHIPWWKRHLLLSILLCFTVLPVALLAVGLGGLILLGKFATVGGGWPFSIAVPGIALWLIVHGYRQSERRWNSHSGTKVIEVRPHE